MHDQLALYQDRRPRPSIGRAQLPPVAPATAPQTLLEGGHVSAGSAVTVLLMQINGAEGDKHGYALLIAASPHSRNPAMHAADALPALSAVPPGMLLGTATASVVQLADPDDPNTVLSQLRTAAAHDGPLLLHIAGQLMLDTRQQLPHLALAKSTPRTVRYTGLPWHWLQSELQHRPAGSTTVLADLVADDAFWEHRGRHPLDSGIVLYGAVVPQLSRRRSATPAYSHAVASVLRAHGNSGAPRPGSEQLHHQAVAEAGFAGAAGARVMLLGGSARVGGDPAAAAPPPAPRVPPHTPQTSPADAPPPGAAPEEDPLERIFAAAHTGRHGEASAMAATWEQAALRKGGPGSPEAIHWVEVRADLARIAGDPDRSCRLWLHAAAARLQSGQSPDAAETFGAVDRAHHCWHQILDPATARELGLVLAELREWAPGARPGALQDVQARLATLEQSAGPLPPEEFGGG